MHENIYFNVEGIQYLDIHIISVQIKFSRHILFTSELLFFDMQAKTTFII